MLSKNKRLEAITKIVEKKGTVRVSEIVTSLNVSDMTVRRDFTELEELGIYMGELRVKIHFSIRSCRMRINMS